MNMKKKKNKKKKKHCYECHGEGYVWEYSDNPYVMFTGVTHECFKCKGKGKV